ncbi:MAG: winged helix-turn-helix domain-containing protein [bacterium]|nr:winged helix-turn-helix domain-containing protein [bacterium]
MIFRFDRFELDLGTVELRENGRPLALEPQVFAVLALLIAQRDRLVSRDDLVATVWDGRVVSDAAIASRIKSARQALGDDGRAQRFIKTVHGRGFRFVAPVAIPSQAVSAPEPPPEAEPAVDPGARPSIAVLPFRFIGEPGPYAAIADGLPDELIAELARLRWLFVTARGSSFRLRAADVTLEDVGRRLGVRYCLTGTAEILGSHLTVAVELSDTRDARIVWAERFDGGVGDVHRIRADIRARVLIELELRIPQHEANLARLAGSENLDAWAAYHLGLQHMFRFDRAGNAAAAALFERAIGLDPGFARAHAGRSFLHFQSAFLRHTADRDGEIARAHRCAERGLELEPLDPFVNFTMGRCYWLVGDLGRSLPWLERATAISPSYAQGMYARAWTEALGGRPDEGRAHVDVAMRLSPLDPLHYAMLATRALAHLAEGDDPTAAAWAERAALAPGAHVLIAMIAVAAHALGGDPARAAAWAADVRARDAALGQADFFRAFPMRSEALRVRIATGLARFGL